MREDLYEGALADLATRGKTVQTEQDEAAMKCRWIRPTIHKELDVNRESFGAAAASELPV